ncbi:MAG: hypothetical protein ACLFN1_05040 [Bacteroidales bacterium]
MRHKVIIYLFCMSLVVLSGCKESAFKSIDEGEIHYNIRFVDRNAVLPDDLMPDKLVIKFKDDKILMEIESPIGNNGVYNIIDPEKKEIKTYFRIMGIKYYYTGTTDEIPPGIDPMSDMTIEYTDQSSTILDFECRKAVVNLPGRDLSYGLWYTDEIDIDSPNLSNPFQGIDGVLMNFFFLMGDIIVEFDAEAIYHRDVPDKDFEKKENYRRIDRKSMDDLITSMMNL